MDFKDLISGNYKIILASQSKRRQSLMEEMGLKFELKLKDVDESYPDHLQCEQVVEYIAEKKSVAFADNDLLEGAILITADTIVWLDGGSLLKPKDEQDAINMLGK